MIQRVYEQALKAKTLSNVVVATDDERILKEVNRFGGSAIMTKEEHQSGTDRVFECYKKAEFEADVIINIQGDEPYISPTQIDFLVSCFEDSSIQIATLAKQIEDAEALFDSNKVKVIMDKNANAIYFSRQVIPYLKGVSKELWHKEQNYFKHIGMYAYRAGILQDLVELEQSNLEISESLEQLRWIENGYKIKVLKTEEEAFAVDTPEDLIKLIDLKK
jgi:3-deoxy-manno-octulosonate cytidylyltransferase (CMP-KDO synthetase)